MAGGVHANGDLNNTRVLRKSTFNQPDPAYARRTLAIPEDEDDRDIRAVHRPYLLPGEIASSDWVSKLELSTTLKMAEADLAQTGERVKVLVLYGSLRGR